MINSLETVEGDIDNISEEIEQVVPENQNLNSYFKGVFQRRFPDGVLSEMILSGELIPHYSKRMIKKISLMKEISKTKTTKENKKTNKELLFSTFYLLSEILDQFIKTIIAYELFYPSWAGYLAGHEEISNTLVNGFADLLVLDQEKEVEILCYYRILNNYKKWSSIIRDSIGPNTPNQGLNRRFGKDYDKVVPLKRILEKEKRIKSYIPFLIRNHENLAKKYSSILHPSMTGSKNYKLLLEFYNGEKEE